MAQKLQNDNESEENMWQKFIEMFSKLNKTDQSSTVCLIQKKIDFKKLRVYINTNFNLKFFALNSFHGNEFWKTVSQSV